MNTHVSMHTQNKAHMEEGEPRVSLAEIKILRLEDEMSSLFPSELADLDHHRGSNNTNKEKRIRLLLDRGAPLPAHQG